MVGPALRLRLFAGGDALGEEGQIRYPLLLRNAVEQQQGAAVRQPVSGKGPGEGDIRTGEDIAGAPVCAHAQHLDACRLEPPKGAGNIQHILGRGGNEGHRDVPQGGQVGTKLFALNIPNAAHAAGYCQGDVPLPADSHGAGGGKGAGDPLRQGGGQPVTVNAAQLGSPGTEGEELLHSADHYVSAVHPGDGVQFPGPAPGKLLLGDGNQAVGQKGGFNQKRNHCQPSRSLTLSTFTRVRGR